MSHDYYMTICYPRNSTHVKILSDIFDNRGWRWNSGRRYECLLDEYSDIIGLCFTTKGGENGFTYVQPFGSRTDNVMDYIPLDYIKRRFK